MLTSIELVLQHLKSNSKHDWFDQVDDKQCLISGWCTLAPHRYGLLALILLMLGLLYQITLFTLAALVLIAYTTQRFSLWVTVNQAVCFKKYFLAVIPYQVKYLPLDCQLSIEGSTDPVNIHDVRYPTHSNSSHSSVYLFLEHHLLPPGYQPVLHCEYTRALQLQKLFTSQLKHFMQVRLSDNSGKKIEYFTEEPGEWMICLIELLPKVFGPRRIFKTTHCQLSWWAPRLQTTVPLAIIAILLASVSFYAPLFVLIVYLLFACIMITQRETYWMNHSELHWKRYILGICIAHKQWNTLHHIKPTLHTHLYAPSGDYVMIYDTERLQTHVVGNSWDSAWIYYELKQALQQYATQDFNKL